MRVLPPLAPPLTVVSCPQKKSLIKEVVEGRERRKDPGAKPGKVALKPAHQPPPGRRVERKLESLTKLISQNSLVWLTSLER